MEDKLLELYSQGLSIADVHRQFPQYSYRYIRRQMLKSKVYSNGDAMKKYNSKRKDTKAGYLESAREQVQSGVPFKEIAKKEGVSYNTLMINMRQKLKDEKVRVYNGIIVDYGDGTRDCMDCRKRGPIRMKRCEDCKKD